MADDIAEIVPPPDPPAHGPAAPQDPNNAVAVIQRIAEDQISRRLLDLILSDSDDSDSEWSSSYSSWVEGCEGCGGTCTGGFGQGLIGYNAGCVCVVPQEYCDRNREKCCKGLPNTSSEARQRVDRGAEEGERKRLTQRVSAGDRDNRLKETLTDEGKDDHGGRGDWGGRDRVGVQPSLEDVIYQLAKRERLESDEARREEDWIDVLEQMNRKSRAQVARVMARRRSRERESETLRERYRRGRDDFGVYDRDDESREPRRRSDNPRSEHVRPEPPMEMSGGRSPGRSAASLVDDYRERKTERRRGSSRRGYRDRHDGDKESFDDAEESHKATVSRRNYRGRSRGGS